MGQKDRSGPPGPNPREDQMTEKDQEQLRRVMRERLAKEGRENPAKQDESAGGEEKRN